MHLTIIPKVIIALALVTVGVPSAAGAQDLTPQTLRMLDQIDPNEKVASDNRHLDPNTPDGLAAWREFGKKTMASATDKVRSANDVDKVRWLVAKLTQEMEVHDVLADYSLATRTGRYTSNQLRLKCDEMSDIIDSAIRGAGLVSVSNTLSFLADRDAFTVFRTVGEKEELEYRQSPSKTIPLLDTNMNHVAFGATIGGEIYVFDPWQWGRETGSYANFHMNNPWNGMPLAEWASKMRDEKYFVVSVNGGDRFHSMRDFVPRLIKQTRQRHEKRLARERAKKNAKPTFFTYNIVNIYTDGKRYPATIEIDTETGKIRIGSWLTKQIIFSCDPGKSLSFRKYEGEGYWNDCHWKFSDGIKTIKGSCKDSRGKSATTEGNLVE